MVQELTVQSFSSKIESAPTINVEQNFEKNSSNSFENNVEVEKIKIGVGDGNLPTVNLPPIAVSVPAVDSGLADVNTTISSDDNPLIAGDDDLIEKEWVEKAKRIISETHDDPYTQDKAVNRLQADYINKRYGRKLGLPPEN